jgi:hypothetical protein
MSAATRIDEDTLVRRIQERATDRDAAFAELFEAYRVRVFTIGRGYGLVAAARRAQAPRCAAHDEWILIILSGPGSVPGGLASADTQGRMGGDALDR